MHLYLLPAEAAKRRNFFVSISIQPTSFKPHQYTSLQTPLAKN